MRRRLVAIAAVVAAVAGGAGVYASAASACAYGGTTCHGTIQWIPTLSFTGGLATINASVQSVPNPNTDFVNHEMWIGTNNDPGSSLGPEVEEGLKEGTEDGSTSVGYVVFWEEFNTQFQGAYHFVQFASTNTNYNVKISYSGSSSWGVYLNGSQVGGSSHSQPCCSRFLQVGGETTTSQASLNATGSSLQKRDSNNNWSYNWGGGPYTDGPGNPLTPSWLTTGASMQVTG